MQNGQSQKTVRFQAKTSKDQRVGGESLDPVPLPAPPPQVPAPPSKPEGPSFTSQLMRETNISPLSTPSSTASGVVSLFYNKNFWIALLVILLILSFLGVNFVMLMGQLFQPIVNVFWILVSQIMSLFGYTTGTVLNKTVDVVSGTAKAGIDIAEGTVQSVGNLLIKGSSSEVGPMTQAKITANIQGSPPPQVLPPPPPPTAVASPPPAVQQVLPSTLDQVLNMSSRRKPTKEPAPDVSTSSIQTPKWCFVGEIDGNRTCAEVQSSNMCLSGQFYKTQETCEKVSTEGFVAGNGPLMMATPLPPTPPPESYLQVAPTGALLQLPVLGPPQYMGPPNFPPPGMGTLQPSVGAALLGVGPPNYLDISNSTRSVRKGQ